MYGSLKLDPNVKLEGNQPRADDGATTLTTDPRSIPQGANNKLAD